MVMKKKMQGVRPKTAPPKVKLKKPVRTSAATKRLSKRGSQK